MRRLSVVLAILGAALSCGCALIDLFPGGRPGLPTPAPTPTPTPCPNGLPPGPEGCTPAPDVPPNGGRVCNPGETCGCYHKPPGQDWTALPACPPPGGDIPQGVDWVVVSPKPAPSFLARVRLAVERASGCSSIDGRCVVEMPMQAFLAKVIDELRSAGVCAGQHEPGVSNAIFVSDCDRLEVNEEWHVYGCLENCQTGTAAFGEGAYKNSWRKPAVGPPPDPEAAACAPAVTGFRDVKVMTHVGRRFNINTTPEACNRDWCAQAFGGRNCCPVGPGEGDERKACEARLVGSLIVTPLAGAIERVYAETMLVVVRVKPEFTEGSVRICAEKAPTVCVIATFR